MASGAAKEPPELCPPRRESELPQLRENAGPNGKQLRSNSLPPCMNLMHSSRQSQLKSLGCVGFDSGSSKLLNPTPTSLKLCFEPNCTLSRNFRAISASSSELDGFGIK